MSSALIGNTRICSKGSKAVCLSGVTNLSHIVGKTHITTSAGRGGKRFALRISGLRDPATGKKIEGNEDNYNKVIANRGFGEDPSTLV